MNRQFGGFLLAAMMVIAGCGGSDRAADVGGGADQTPVGGDWLVQSYEAEADTLNRIISSNAYTGYIMEGSMGSMVGEYLLGYDPETWRVEKPLLAESYPEISEDHLTYTFTARAGVRWHDGEPFSAEDILFSMKATMNPFVDSAALRGYFADVSDAQVDGRTIRFEMRQPYYLNADQLGNSLAILPKHVYDPEGFLDDYSYADIISASARDDEQLRAWGDEFNRNPANRRPLGTGPYKFESWESGSQIVLVRNDDYWGEQAYLDRIVIRFITDGTAALTALKSGETDFNHRLTSIQYAQQTSGAEFESQFVKSTYKVPSYYYIGWNSQRPFFADKRVRQAMTMLIPRQDIIDNLRFGLAEIAASPLNPSSADYNPTIEAFPHDPDRAAELLDEAGWVDSDGDGIRDKGGVKFSFEYLGSAGSQFTEQIIPIMNEAFGRAGIEMTERRLEFTILVENMKDKQFDAYGGAWLSPLTSDPYQLWHSSSSENRGSNYTSFINPEADRLIEEARQEFDAEKRKELYWRFQELVHEEQPYSFLFYPEESAAYHRRFQQVDFVPVRPGYDLTKWFVPLVSQRYSEMTPQ